MHAEHMIRRGGSYKRSGVAPRLQGVLKVLNRRSLLKGTLAVPLALIANRWVSSQVTPPYSADYGVASGDPRPDGMVLWTRVPEVAQFPSGEMIAVHYEVATSPHFSLGSIAAEGDVVTDGAVDYTVKVVTEGLAPATRYYYRFSTKTGYQSVVGRTQTAPAPDAHPQTIRFAFVSCQNFTEGFYTVYVHLAREQVDFCVHLGDNIYEAGHTGFAHGHVRRDNIGNGLATDLTTYRQKYQLYLSDPYLREVRRRFPWVVLWDDHELYSNYAGPVVSRQNPQRQRDAYSAFLEYMPVQPIEPLSADDPPRVRLYRQLAFGALLEVFVLDERQYRDGVVCERDFLIAGCPDLEAPTRTMLGEVQKSWLKSALQASTAQWKCLLNEDMMMRFTLINQQADAAGSLPLSMLHQPAAIDEDVYVNLDAWDGYPRERTELLQFIADQGIRNVVVCTGDFHNCYAGVLRPDFRDSSSPAVAVEFVGASVSSFGSAEIIGRDLTMLGRKLVPAANPHINFLDLKHHVYTKVIVTPARMEVRYIAVETVSQPASRAFLLQRFIVPDGQSILIPGERTDISTASSTVWRKPY
jgi:alkaline phosphatase D